MKRLLVFSVIWLVAAAGARGSSIAWVSFHGADDAPSAGAAGAGFTEAPDVGYTALLENAGHAVTRFFSQDVGDATAGLNLAATYNTYDLVIISRSVASGHYQQQPEYEMWNQQITVPVIDMSGYTLRNSRLGFTTGGDMPDTAGDIRLAVDDPGHPIFAGLSLDGSNVMVDVFAGINGLQRGISVNNNPVAGNGDVLATVATVGDPAEGGMIIGEWQAGSAMATATPTTLAGHRLVFLSGSREQDTVSSETAGVLDLSATGQTMFLNAVEYMAIPEPATLGLMALGAIALGLRRRPRR